MHLVKGDRSVEDFTHEFLRLGRFAPDVMQDEDRAFELFVIGLGSDYISIRPGGRTLHSVEEARQLERRYTMYGNIADPYAGSSGRGVMAQGVQQPVFLLGSTGAQAGTSHQQKIQRTHRPGRKNHRSGGPSRFGNGSAVVVDRVPGMAVQARDLAHILLVVEYIKALVI